MRLWIGTSTFKQNELYIAVWNHCEIFCQLVLFARIFCEKYTHDRNTRNLAVILLWYVFIVDYIEFNRKEILGKYFIAFVVGTSIIYAWSNVSQTVTQFWERWECIKRCLFQNLWKMHFVNWQIWSLTIIQQPRWTKFQLYLICKQFTENNVYHWLLVS